MFDRFVVAAAGQVRVTDAERGHESSEFGVVDLRSGLCLSTFRRQAAVLASYLAQFDTTDTDCPNPRDAGGTALTEREKEQYRRDYHQAAYWVIAAEITDDDIAALARMRRRHGFPTR